MKNNLKTTHLVFLSLILVSLGVVIGLVYGGMLCEKRIDEDSFSRYISPYDGPSENLTTQNLLGKDSGLTPDLEINEVKLGVLEENPNRKVVKFNEDLTQQEKQRIETEYGVVFTNDVSRNGIYVVNVDESSDLDLLESEPLVSSVEIDQPIKLLSQKVDWGIQRIGAQKVWEKASGANVVVAVIDTGVQTDHEDLKNNVVGGFDFVNNNNNAYDDNGHGTHVAGIIAAYDNSLGIVGGAHRSKIMPVKVLNAQGYGYLSDVAKGIYYAADNNAQIINLSLGTTHDSSILRDAVLHASNKGLLVVGAAGNSSGNACLYPAAYVEVICVVATDQDNKLASFSNRGGEFSAPGVSNYSTYINNRYAYLSGTSMAAPHVSASAALLLSFCDDCTLTQVREILRETAVDLGEVGRDSIFGYGLVDVFSAIDSLLEEEEETEEIEEEEQVEVPKPEEEKPQTPPVTRRPDTPPPPVVRRPVFQSLRVLEPELDRSKRLVLTSLEDIGIKFELNPQVNDSNIEKTVLLVDNEEVFTTREQMGEYTLKTEVLTNNQYVIRIIAYFKDGRQAHENFIIDLTRARAVERNNRGNPNIPQNRRVLGVSTQFRY